MTYVSRRARRCLPALAAPLMLAGALAAGLSTAPGAAAAGCQNVTGGQPPNPGATVNVLFGVTTLQSCDAWAAGFFEDTHNVSQSLLEHWNGFRWRSFTPEPVRGATNTILSSVSGIPAAAPGARSRNVWAVGTVAVGGTERTLIEHWGGSAWTQVPSFSVSGSDSQLSGVKAVSASEAWAVGQSFTASTGFRVIIEHWTPKGGWRPVTVSNPGGPGTSNRLTAVTATGHGDVWAAGVSTSGGVDHPLILHYNGKSWKQVPAPAAPGFQLAGVAASSRANAWAVGSDHNQTQSLALHWNGRKWSRVSMPSPGGSLVMTGVATASAKSAWAVGIALGRPHTTIFLSWNGKKWQVQPSQPGELAGVSVGPGADVWAVGDVSSGAVTSTLFVHCTSCDREA